MAGLTVQNRAQAGRTLRIGNKDVSFDAEGVARDVPADCEMFAPDGRSMVRGFQLLDGDPITPADQEMQDAGGMAHVYCPPRFAGKTLSCVGGPVTFDENGYAYAPAHYFKGVSGFRVELDEPIPEIQQATSLADLPDMDGSVRIGPQPCPECHQYPGEQTGEYPCLKCGEPTLHDPLTDAVSEGFRSRAIAAMPPPAPEYQPPAPNPDEEEGTGIQEFEETVFQPPTGEVPPTDQTFLPMVPSGNLDTATTEHPANTPPEKPKSRKRTG
jgi:hypothetical protein